MVTLTSNLDSIFLALLLWLSDMSCSLYVVPHKPFSMLLPRPALEHKSLIRSQVVIRRKSCMVSMSGPCGCIASHLKPHGSLQQWVGRAHVLVGAG